MNPYSQNTFFQFFGTLFMRIWSGKGELATDEIQLIVLSLIAVSCALLGAFLVLRKATMLTNALSHTILSAVVFAFFIHQMFHQSQVDFVHLFPSDWLLIAMSLLMALLTTFLTQFLVSSAKIQEDASCGVVFTFLFAFGILLVTALSRNAHIGTEMLMGNVDTLTQESIPLIFWVTCANGMAVLLFFRVLCITTFDPLFSSILGISCVAISYLLMAEVAITTVAAFRAVGSLLVLAFFVGPPLIARLYTSTMRSFLWLSVGIGVLAACIGVSLSRHLLSLYGLAVSTSALTVVIILALFLLSLIYTARPKRRKHVTSS
jgi:manganese/zinc/iron transport system permease protein